MHFYVFMFVWGLVILQLMVGFTLGQCYLDTGATSTYSLILFLQLFFHDSCLGFYKLSAAVCGVWVCRSAQYRCVFHYFTPCYSYLHLCTGYTLCLGVRACPLVLHQKYSMIFLMKSLRKCPYKRPDWEIQACLGLFFKLFS